MARVIELKWPARCLDCGTELPAGTSARYYGRGRIYGLQCHGKNGDVPAAKPATRRVPGPEWPMDPNDYIDVPVESTSVPEGESHKGERVMPAESDTDGAPIDTSPVVPPPTGDGVTVSDPFGALSPAAKELAGYHQGQPHSADDCTDLHGPHPDGAACPDAPPHKSPADVARGTANRRRAAAKKKVKKQSPLATFTAAVRRVARGIGRRPGIPALAGILLHAEPFGKDGTRLTLTATDLELTVSEVIELPGPPTGGEWRALVPGKELIAALKAKPYSDSDGRFRFGPIVLTADGPELFSIGAARIPTLPASDFPALKWMTGEGFRFPAVDLAGAIAAVTPAASKDEARPVLTGVQVEWAGKDAETVTLVATDSYRLHLADVPVTVLTPFPPDKVKDGVSALLPARALAELGKVIGRDGGEVTCHVDETRAELTYGEWRIITRRIDGEFPNYRMLLPEPSENSITDVGDLAAIIAQAAPMAGDNRPVALELNGSVRVTITPTIDEGGFDATSSATYAGEEMTVRFNPYYIGAALTATGDDPTVYVRDDLKPAMIVGSGNRPVRALIMPVKPR